MLLLILVFLIEASGQWVSECPLSANRSDLPIYRKLQWLRPNISVMESSTESWFAEVRCETGFLQNHLISKSYVVQCTGGTFNHSLRYDDFLCRSHHQANTTTYRKRSEDSYFGLLKCVGKNLVAYDVGHLQPRGCAKRLYTVCVDVGDLRTKFGYEVQVTLPMRNQTKVGCKKGVFGFNEFGQTIQEKKTLSKAYYQKYQKQRITSLYPNRYNRRKPYPYYFNRGHIVPSGDFSECEQAATYEHINLAPQWDVLNQGSWNFIEEETRNTIRNCTWKWAIYTGTYGKIQTPKGIMYLIPLFNENGAFRKALIPVPMLYWKIAYNKLDSTKSLVYVGVNNPEFKSFEEIPSKYFICKPIKNKHGKFFIGSEFKGFVYQCDLAQFLQKLMINEGIVV